MARARRRGHPKVTQTSSDMEPMPPTEPNYDAMARAWQEEGLGENPPPLPRMEPPPPPPPEPLAFAAANVKVQFFGVAPNNAYLKPTGIGIGRGPTGKAESTSSKIKRGT